MAKNEEFEALDFDLTDLKLDKNLKKNISEDRVKEEPELEKNDLEPSNKDTIKTKEENLKNDKDEYDLNLNDLSLKLEENITLPKGDKSSFFDKLNSLKGLFGKKESSKENSTESSPYSEESKNDIKYVNSLYSAANEEVPFTVNTVFTILVAVIVSLIVWANIAKIDELTKGEGKVIPSSKLQTVQSFDGGIVSEILIKDGDYVIKDQPLMKIDTTRFQATFEENQESLLSLKAKKVRLEKELITDYTKPMKDLVFKNGLRTEAVQYIKNQKKVYKSKFLERRNTLKIIELQKKQKKQELKEIYAKQEELKDSMELLKEELDTIEKMVNSGSKSKVELLQIKKEYNTLKGELRSVDLSIPRTKLSIEESLAQINEKLQSFKSEVSQELEKTISEIKIIEAKMVSDSDKLEKTVIKSPVNGTIKQININTIGSVVKTGENLIEIVPDSDILLIEAKIDPKDIAFINPNSKTLVKLTAYDFSIYGGLEGKIVEISADSIKDTDSKDNKSYYKVMVKTEQNYLEHKGKKLTVIPGMVAQVDIITGKKTIMDFFLKPILKVKEGAFHER